VAGPNRDSSRLQHTGREGEQVAKRVHGHMHLRPALSLGAVIARTAATLRRRAQGAAVDDRRRRLLRTARREAEQGAQVLSQRLETSCRQPALGLLIHSSPRRKVVWHGAPGNAVADHVAKGVEQLVQGVLTLRRCLGHQGDIRDNQLPFIIADIRRIGLARRGRTHPSPLSLRFIKLHNTL
jgi:hypothetical protein